MIPNDAITDEDFQLFPDPVGNKPKKMGCPMLVAKEIRIAKFRTGPDLVSVRLNLPDPMEQDEGLWVDFRCRNGCGVTYCQLHIPGVDIQLTDVEKRAVEMAKAP